MKKILTDTEKVAALTGAISRADRELNLILEPMDHRTSERLLTVCRRVRKILRRALEKVCGPHAGQAAGGACTAAVGRTYRPPDGQDTQSGKTGASTCTEEVGTLREPTKAAGGSTKKGGRRGKA